MTTIDVERLRFEFEDEWTVVEKWDDTRVFQNGICRLNGKIWDEELRVLRSVGSKAVDIVAVRERDLYLIEVKDLRGHPEVKEEQVRGRALEIALKVRDSVAGVVGAGRLENAEEWTSTCAKLLAERGRLVTVIAWVEEGGPRPGQGNKKRAVQRGTLKKDLERHLAWLTPKVSVRCLADQPTIPIPGMSVFNLPGAGQS